MTRHVGFSQKLILILSLALAVFAVSCATDPTDDNGGNGNDVPLKTIDDVLEVVNKYDESEAGITSIKTFLETGNINATTDGGDTALIITASYGYADIAQALIDAGADLNVQNLGGDTALINAANNSEGSDGYTEIALALINAGADVNIEDSDGNVALILAANRGNVTVVKALLDKGADKTVENIFGDTAYSRAKKNEEISEADKTTLLALLDFEGNPDK